MLFPAVTYAFFPAVTYAFSIGKSNSLTCNTKAIEIHLKLKRKI